MRNVNPTERLLCALVLVLLVSARARADDVVVTLVGAEADKQHVWPVVVELLGRAGFVAQREDSPETDVRAALDSSLETTRAWFDLREPDHVALYFASNARVVTRSVESPRGLDSVAVDEAGHIAADVVDALRRGEELGMTHAEAREELPEERIATPVAFVDSRPHPPERSATRDAGLVVGADYGVEAWAADTVVHGPGVMTGVRLGWFTLELEARYRTAVRPSNDLVAARIDGFSGRATLVAAAGLTDRVGLSFGVGGALATTRIAPSSTSTGNVKLEQERTYLDPAATAEASILVRLTRRLSASLAIGVEATPTPWRAVVLINGTPEPLLEPWAVRPSLRFALMGMP